MTRRRTFIRWPRVNLRMGPVGVSLGASSAILSVCCCGCNLWMTLLLSAVATFTTLWYSETRKAKETK